MVKPALDADPTALLGWVSFADGHASERVFFPRDDWSFVDIERSVLAGLAPDVISEFVGKASNFDIAIVPIGDTTASYLGNKGIRPFIGDELSWTLEELFALSPDHRPSMFVAGVPEASYTLGDQVLNYEFKVFRLYPGATEDEQGEVRLLESEGVFSKIPTCWDQKDWSSGVDGISGGPVVILVEGRLMLLGVEHQQHKREGTNIVTHLGVCEIWPVVKALATCLAAGLDPLVVVEIEI
jgi:hypothetical protein